MGKGKLRMSFQLWQLRWWSICLLHSQCRQHCRPLLYTCQHRNRHMCLHRAPSNLRYTCSLFARRSPPVRWSLGGILDTHWMWHRPLLNIDQLHSCCMQQIRAQPCNCLGYNWCRCFRQGLTSPHYTCSLFARRSPPVRQSLGGILGTHWMRHRPPLNIDQLHSWCMQQVLCLTCMFPRRIPCTCPHLALYTRGCKCNQSMQCFLVASRNSQGR